MTAYSRAAGSGVSSRAGPGVAYSWRQRCQSLRSSYSPLVEPPQPAARRIQRLGQDWGDRTLGLTRETGPRVVIRKAVHLSTRWNETRAAPRSAPRQRLPYPAHAYMAQVLILPVGPALRFAVPAPVS